MAAPALGGSAEFAAVLNQLGGMGSNYLTEVMTDTATRLRREQDPASEGGISPEQWRDALAEVLEARLAGSDEQARQLRAEVGRVLRSVDAVAVALAESATSADEVRDWLTDAIRALGTEIEELRWIQVSLAQALAGVQVELAEQSSRQRQQMDLTRRSLLAVTTMRAEILDSISAAVGASEPRPESPGRHDEVCPYPGLASFQVEDALWFVGREATVAELLGRLAEQRDSGGPLVVVGVSGVGKSSVLRAGLLPALARGDLGVPGSQTWPWMLLTPGTKPLTELAARTATLAGVSALDVLDDLQAAPERFGALAAQAGRAAQPDGRGAEDSRLVIVVDQFEELFTQGVETAEREAFVTALTSAAPALVVLAVRADFYPQCIRMERLAPLLPDQQLVIGPLRVDDLRRVVVQPAARVGLQIEPGLVELLLADLGVQADGGYEPGALPLLAYALRATWTRRRDRTLTIDGYQQSGGIANAVAETAEAIYQRLDERGQQALRAALLRTVAVGVPETGLVRRKADREDIDPEVLARLVEARLVTVDEDSVEISHEALLYAWPRLTEWLAEDRQGLRVHQQLAQATDDWNASGQDESLLYRGARLVATREWASGRRDLTTSQERFLLAGAAAAERAIRQEQHRSRRLRQLVAIMVVLLLAAVTGATGAVIARNGERDRAAEALSRQFAAQSGVAATSNMRGSMELAALAWQTSRTTEARGALLSAQMLQQAGLLDDPAGSISVALSGDGRWVATGAPNGEIRLWDAVSHRQRAVLRGHGSPVFQLAFSPDSKLLASASTEWPGARIWEVPSGRLLQILPAVATVSWRPGGRELASLGLGADVRWQLITWDTAADKETSRVTLGKRPISKLAYGPAGDRIALGYADGTVELRRMPDAKLLATLDRPAGAPQAPAVVAFARDGRLATGTAKDGQIQFWDSRTGKRIGRTSDSPGRTSVSALVFTPDGRNLIVAGGSQFAEAWNFAEQAWLGSFFAGQTGTTLDIAVDGAGRLLVGAGTGQRTMLWRLADDWFTTGDTQGVTDLAFDPRGRRLALGGVSGAVTVQDLPTNTWQPRAKNSRRINALGYARDGTLATASDDGAVRIYDPAGKIRKTLTYKGYTVDELTFSPDGSLLVVSTEPPIARDPGTTASMHGFDVYDVKTLESILPVNLGAVDPAALEFTPDGRHLVVTATEFQTDGALGTDALVRLWRTQDLREKRNTVEREFRLEPGALYDSDISPDGRTLAVAGADRRVQLWDLAAGRKTESFGSHPGAIRALAYSPDGRSIATAITADPLVRLWDVTGRSLAANLSGHGDGVNRVEFALDGSAVASAGADGFVGIWNLRPDRALDRICQSITGASLDADWRDLKVTPAHAPCR